MLLTTLLAVPLVGALVALAVAWLLCIGYVSLPYARIGELWHVQLHGGESWRERYGPTAQMSLEGVRRLALDAKQFDELTLAMPVQLSQLAAETAPFALQGSVNALSVSANYWRVLGASFAHGRAPAADGTEVAVAARLAKRLYGRADAAVGREVVFEGGAYRIVGVHPDQMPAPLPLDRQRNEAGSIDLYIPDLSIEQRQWSVSDAGDLLMIIRHVGPETAMLRQLQQHAGIVAAELGRSGWQIHVDPLEVMMRGDDRRWALMLAFGVALALVITLSGLVMVARARFSQRGATKRMLWVLGAPGGTLHRFETVECVLLASGIGVVSVLVVAACLAALRMNSVMAGVIDTRFTLLAVGFVVVFSVVCYGLLEWAGRCVTPRRQNSPGGVLLGRGSNRSAASELMFRLTLVGQTGLALVAVTAASFGLRDGIAAFSAWRSVELDGVWHVELRVSEGGAPAEIESALHMSKERIAGRYPDSVSAVSRAGPLDLIGDAVGYDGPRHLGGTVEHMPDGSLLLRSSRAPTVQDLEAVSYRLSVVEVEPEFFAVLGYRLREGRVFDATREETLLSVEAAQVLFGRSSQVVDEPIPAAPRLAGVRWHHRLAVVGVVNDGRMGSAGLGPLRFEGAPVVFVPFRGLSPRRVGAPLVVHLVVRIDPKAGNPKALIEPVFASLLADGAELRVSSVADEAWARLKEHVLAALGLVLLAVCMVAAAVSGAYGSAGLLAERRGIEMAVKRALGVPSSPLANEFLSRELIAPALLCAFWLMVVMAAQAALAWSGAGVGALLVAAVAAVPVTLGAVALGLYVRLRHAVRSAPAVLLRDA